MTLKKTYNGNNVCPINEKRKNPVGADDVGIFCQNKSNKRIKMVHPYGMIHATVNSKDWIYACRANVVRPRLLLLLLPEDDLLLRLLLLVVMLATSWLLLLLSPPTVPVVVVVVPPLVPPYLVFITSSVGGRMFVCAFLGSILGAVKVYHRHNLKILINVLNVKLASCS